VCCARGLTGRQFSRSGAAVASRRRLLFYDCFYDCSLRLLLTTAAGQRCSSRPGRNNNADPAALLPRRFRVSVVVDSRTQQHRRPFAAVIPALACAASGGTRSNAHRVGPISRPGPITRHWGASDVVASRDGTTQGGKDPCHGVAGADVEVTGWPQGWSSSTVASLMLAPVASERRRCCRPVAAGPTFRPSRQPERNPVYS
jgi:hypothetical protein